MRIFLIEIFVTNAMVIGCYTSIFYDSTEFSIHSIVVFADGLISDSNTPSIKGKS